MEYQTLKGRLNFLIGVVGLMSIALLMYFANFSGRFNNIDNTLQRIETNQLNTTDQTYCHTVDVTTLQPGTLYIAVPIGQVSDEEATNTPAKTKVVTHKTTFISQDGYWSTNHRQVNSPTREEDHTEEMTVLNGDEKTFAGDYLLALFKALARTQTTHP